MSKRRRKNGSIARRKGTAQRKKLEVPIMVAEIMGIENAAGENAASLFLAGLDGKDLDKQVDCALDWMFENGEDPTVLMESIRNHLAASESALIGENGEWVRLLAVPVSGSLEAIAQWATHTHAAPESMPLGALTGFAQTMWLPVPMLPEEVHAWGGEERQALLQAFLAGPPDGRAQRVAAWAAQTPSAAVVVPPSPESGTCVWGTRVLVGVVLGEDRVLYNHAARFEVSGWPWHTSEEVWDCFDTPYEEGEDEERTADRERLVAAHEERKETDNARWVASAAKAGMNGFAFGAPSSLLEALTERIVQHVLGTASLERCLEAPGAFDPQYRRLHVTVEETDTRSALWLGLEDTTGRVWGPCAVNAFERLSLDAVIGRVCQWVGIEEEAVVLHQSVSGFPMSSRGDASKSMSPPLPRVH